MSITEYNWKKNKLNTKSNRKRICCRYPHPLKTSRIDMRSFSIAELCFLNYQTVSMRSVEIQIISIADVFSIPILLNTRLKRSPYFFWLLPRTKESSFMLFSSCCIRPTGSWPSYRKTARTSFMDLVTGKRIAFSAQLRQKNTAFNHTLRCSNSAQVSKTAFLKSEFLTSACPSFSFNNATSERAGPKALSDFFNNAASSSEAVTELFIVLDTSSTSSIPLQILSRSRTCR